MEKADVNNHPLASGRRQDEPRGKQELRGLRAGVQYNQAIAGPVWQ